VRALRSAVGSANVLTDPQLLAPYERDWTGRFHGRAGAVVLPASAAEVAAAVALASEQGVPIVPQGGNTGLVGGAVPPGGGIVVSLRRLRYRGDIDPLARTVRVGAGLTLAELDDLACPHGLAAGLDLAARDAATVGGIVACDAGGHSALRYGTARARVRGLEVVLADGSIVRLARRAPKDNAGYNLVPLLVGSEGTLAVITDVEWELVPRPARRVTVLLAVDSMQRAVDFALALRASVPAVEAIEFMCSACFSLLAEQLSLAAPDPLRPVVDSGGLALLCEVAGNSDDVERFAAFITRHAAGERATLASDEAQRKRLWRLRDAIPEAVSRAGVAHKIDVALPPSRLAEFDRRLRELVPGHLAPVARLVRFGHLGDGNVHVNVLGLPPDAEGVDAAVLELAAACGGTISGEHGIGTAKARYLHLVRSEREIELMRAIKRAFDPRGVLNPGVLLPAP